MAHHAIERTYDVARVILALALISGVAVALKTALYFLFGNVL